MKIVKLILCVVFVLFAAVQYNDVDPYLWIPIYLFAAMICFLSYLNKAPNSLYIFSLILFGAGIAYYVPSLIEWIELGIPSITGAMKAESPFVELVREALGLLIVFLSIGLLYLIQRGKNVKSTVAKANL